MANNISNDDLSITLGNRIRELRKEKNLKIVDLSNLTGLTVSMISQVERAIISPSIETLKKIGNAMDTPVGYFFEDVNQSEPQVNKGNNGQTIDGVSNFVFPEVHPVVHEHQRKMLSPGKGIHFYLLNPNLNGPIEFIYNVYDPGSSTGEGLYCHPGSECGLILEGQLVVQIKDKEYVLEKGDSITFNSSDPHLKKNVSDKVCTCVWANVPPWF
ncbi:MAG: cupin domain-containing protein [Clostridia bacterium]|nr:cupin domain-containing protein [Clostridia bacterium]